MKDFSNCYHTAGRKMRAKRLALDLTQAEAAERTGLSEKYYANLERGVNHARLEIYLRIFTGLEIPLEELSPYYEESPKPFAPDLMDLLFEKFFRELDRHLARRSQDKPESGQTKPCRQTKSAFGIRGESPPPDQGGIKAFPKVVPKARNI